MIPRVMCKFGLHTWRPTVKLEDDNKALNMPRQHH